MVPTTEKSPPGSVPVSQFYDRLAPDYDRMTGFEKRFVHEKPFFRLLVERHGISTALDAGCGTGFHALLLAQLGVRVTAVDVSGDMLRVLASHAHTLRLDVRMLESSFETLHTKQLPKFDAVVCLGNSLAHMMSGQALQLALENFASVLRPGGILFLQNLNFDRILARRERVQSVKEVDGVTYVRFYDYEGDCVRFNILRLERKDGGLAHSLESIPLRPVMRDELLGVLGRTGFADVRTYGGITMEEYQPDTSRDLVVLAHRI